TQVREQISRMRPGTDSSPETVTRLGLVADGLPCPRVNEVVTDPEGRYVKRVDLVYPAERIAIEYDGDQHRTDRAQWREDVRARRRLEELGWIVIVVVGDALRALRPVVARVRAALRRHCPRPRDRCGCTTRRQTESRSRVSCTHSDQGARQES